MLPTCHIKIESQRDLERSSGEPFTGKGCSSDWSFSKFIILKILILKNILSWYCAALRIPVEFKQTLKRMAAFILKILLFKTQTSRQTLVTQAKQQSEAPPAAHVPTQKPRQSHLTHYDPVDCIARVNQSCLFYWHKTENCCNNNLTC